MHASKLPIFVLAKGKKCLTDTTLSVLLLCLLFNLASSQQRSLSVREKQVDTGLHPLAQDTPLVAAAVFQEATGDASESAGAYNQQGLLCMSRNTVSGRIEAEQYFLKALHLAPDNEEYLLNLADLYLLMNFNQWAEKYSHRALRANPQSARAYYLLGRIAEGEMLRYMNMVDPGSLWLFNDSEYDIYPFSQGGVIYFNEFAEKDRLNAVTMYEKAIDFDPYFAPPYHRLAMIFFETDELLKMKELLLRAVANVPDDKNGHLFLGFCYFHLQEYAFANQEYENARTLMPIEEKESYDSMQPLVNRELEEKLHMASPEGQRLLNSAFWKSRDPLYLTEYNERLLEHYGRLLYADLRFGRPEKKIEGWNTDRGKVFLRYGRPMDIIRTRPTLNEYQTMARQRRSTYPWSSLYDNEYEYARSTFSSEYWSYEDFDFLFEDRFLSGDYLFNWSQYPEDDYLYIYREMIKETPEFYSHQYQGYRYELPYYIAGFRGDGNKTRLAVCHSTQVNELPFPLEGELHSRLHRGIFFFTPDWSSQVAFRDTIDLLIPELRMREADRFFNRIAWLQVAPGEYNFALELQDDDTKNLGVEHAEILIENYNVDTLRISDILAGWFITQRQDISSFVPNGARLFYSEAPIAVYFEVYNFSLDKNLRTKFVVEETIHRVDEERSIAFKFLSELGDLLGFSPFGDKLSTTYHYEGSETVESISKTFMLSTPESGTFTYEIRITDLTTGKTVAKMVNITII